MICLHLIPFNVSVQQWVIATVVVSACWTGWRASCTIPQSPILSLTPGYLDVPITPTVQQIVLATPCFLALSLPSSIHLAGRWKWQESSSDPRSCHQLTCHWTLAAARENANCMWLPGSIFFSSTGNGGQFYFNNCWPHHHQQSPSDWPHKTKKKAANDGNLKLKTEYVGKALQGRQHMWRQ